MNGIIATEPIHRSKVLQGGNYLQKYFIRFLDTQKILATFFEHANSDLSPHTLVKLLKYLVKHRIRNAHSEFF